MRKRMKSQSSIDEDEIINNMGCLSISTGAGWRLGNIGITAQDIKEHMDLDYDGANITNQESVMQNKERQDVKRKAEECMPNIRRKKIASENPDEPKILPKQFERLIKNLGGDTNNVVFFFEKLITRVDLDPHFGCFYVATIRDNFFSELEFVELHARGVMRLKLIEPCLRVTDISLEEEDEFIYVLRENWRFVCERKENDFMIGDRVQLWAFRIEGGEPCLVMVKVKDSEDGIDGASD